MYLDAIKNIFSIKGRLNRRQYIVVTLLAVILMMILVPFLDRKIVGIIGTIFILPTAIKRTHDLNWNGCLSLLLFIPLIGTIYHLICLCSGGTQGPNKYGEPPHIIFEKK